MNQFEDIKQNIYSEILRIVSRKNYIISTSIVGSFVSSPGIEGISDIDIVIIVDKLTQSIFEEINYSFQQIKNSEIGLNDFEIFINNTFGPLKFDNGKRFHWRVGVGELCRS